MESVDVGRGNRAVMGSLWSDRAGKFYDRWESADEEERREYIAQSLDAYVAFARESTPFYRDRLRSYRKGAPHPLAEIPALRAEETAGALPPAGRALFSREDGHFTVFQSGGTTGMPKTSLFAADELVALDAPNARAFFAAGLEPGDKVGNFFAVGALYMSFVHTNQMMQQYGCTNFPFTNHAPADFVRTVIGHLGVNVLVGPTSALLATLRSLAAGGSRPRIDKVFYAGEHIYPADREEIFASFGPVSIVSAGYGTVDSWHIGYQCTDCPPGVFHAHDDQCYLEIIDEERGDACRPGEVGIVHVTTFPRRLTPIVRFRAGDRAAWLGEPCACGRTTPLFRLLGRGDDILRIGYDSVDYAFVQAAVAGISGLRGAVQMEKQRRDGKDRLAVRVESGADPANHPALARALEEALLSTRPGLRECVEKGTVEPLCIEIVPAESLPRNPKTGKLIRVIDVL